MEHKMQNYVRGLSYFRKPDLINIKELTSAEQYYDPHIHPSTHEEFLSDRSVFLTFKNWIQDNPMFFKNKVVLDVGCGTGVLSMIAAKTGAALVIGIEWSHIAEDAKRVIQKNGLQNTVKIIRGNVEEIELPDGIEEVDTIISMWPGVSLLHGGRVKRVLYCRDKWLKANGVILPDRANLFISAINDIDYKENNIDVWSNMYGFNLSSIVDDALSKGHITELDPNKIVSNKCCVKKINLTTDSYEDITREVPFQLTAKRNDYVQGYCTYFDISFSKDWKEKIIDTDPRAALTFWRHSCFYIQDPFAIRKKEKIKDKLGIRRVTILGTNYDECTQIRPDQYDMKFEEYTAYL